MSFRKRNGEKEKPGLWHIMVFTELVCRVLPLLLIIALLGFASSRQIREQVLSGVRTGILQSAQVCAGQLETAVNAAYGATYNSDVLGSAWRAYRGGSPEVKGDQDMLYASVTSYLKAQYRYDMRFALSMVCYIEEPDQIYYTHDTTRGATFSQFSDYHTRLHAQVMEYARGLGTNVGFYQDEETDGIFLVRNLVDGTDYEPYAVLILQLDRMSFFDNLVNVAYSKDVTVWLADTPVTLKGAAITAPERERGEHESESGRNLSFVTGEEPFSSYHLGYAVRLDSSLLSKTLSSTWLLILVVSLLVVPLMLLAIRFFTRNVTKPIHTFEGAYRKLESGELGVHVEEEFPSREFDYFSHSFNRMSDRLKRQFEQLYSDELALRDAKIMALQAQINPHFLNNTLEIINWEARMGENERVSEMIEALSTMLDAAMDRGQRPEIPLKEEMRYVSAYLLIISQRLGKRLTVTQDVDETFLACRVPRLIMQPILENAVEHGVEKQKEAFISLRVKRDGERLVLEVENSGTMTDGDVEKIARLLSEDYDASGENSRNLGIRNVHQRLRILYGEGNGLTLSRTDHGTTLARFTMPWKTQ